MFERGKASAEKSEFVPEDEERRCQARFDQLSSIDRRLFSTWNGIDLSIERWRNSSRDSRRCSNPNCADRYVGKTIRWHDLRRLGCSSSIQGKAGNVDRAKEFFLKANSPNISTFTAMSEFLFSSIARHSSSLCRCLYSSFLWSQWSRSRCSGAFLSNPRRDDRWESVCLCSECLFTFGIGRWSSRDLLEHSSEKRMELHSDGENCNVMTSWRRRRRRSWFLIHSGRLFKSFFRFRRFEEIDWRVRKRSSSLFANAQWVVQLVSIDRSIYPEKINNNRRKSLSLLFVVFLVSLLSGIRNQKNGQSAKERSAIIRQLFPSLTDSLTSVSVLVANTLASSGDMKEASDVRWTLSQAGSRKTAGLSWTGVNGEIAVKEKMFSFILPNKCCRNFAHTIDLIREEMKSMRNAIDCWKNCLNMDTSLTPVGSLDHWWLMKASNRFSTDTVRESPSPSISSNDQFPNEFKSPRTSAFAVIVVSVQRSIPSLFNTASFV